MATIRLISASISSPFLTSGGLFYPAGTYHLLSPSVGVIRCEIGKEALSHGPTSGPMQNNMSTQIVLPGAGIGDSAHPISCRLRNNMSCQGMFHNTNEPKFLPTIKLFSGADTVDVSQEIARYLGIELGNKQVVRLTDGEIIDVELLESVNECDVYLVQSVTKKSMEQVIELGLLINACRLSGAASISIVLPYPGYGSLDNEPEPFASRFLRYTIEGCSQVFLCETFKEGSFNNFGTKVEYTYCEDVIKSYMNLKNISSENLVCVAPDVSSFRATTCFANMFDVKAAIIQKKGDEMYVSGVVKDKTAFVVVNSIDSGDLLLESAALLHKEGAKEVYAYCLHPVMSCDAAKKLAKSIIKEVLVTNSVNVVEEGNLKVLSIGDEIGATILRIRKY